MHGLLVWVRSLFVLGTEKRADTRPTATLYLYLRGGGGDGVKKKAAGSHIHTRERKKEERERGGHSSLSLPPSSILFHLASPFSERSRQNHLRSLHRRRWLPQQQRRQQQRRQLQQQSLSFCAASVSIGLREREEEEEEEVGFGLSSVGSSAGWRKAASASVSPKGTLLLKSVGKKKKSEAHFLRSRALPSCLAADSVWGFFSFPPPPLPFLLWPNRNKSSN